jgi:hypothetical protein
MSTELDKIIGTPDIDLYCTTFCENTADFHQLYGCIIEPQY